MILCPYCPAKLIHTLNNSWPGSEGGAPLSMFSSNPGVGVGPEGGDPSSGLERPGCGSPGLLQEVQPLPGTPQNRFRSGPLPRGGGTLAPAPPPPPRGSGPCLASRRTGEARRDFGPGRPAPRHRTGVGGAPAFPASRAPGAARRTGGIPWASPRLALHTRALCQTAVPTSFLAGAGPPSLPPKLGPGTRRGAAPAPGPRPRPRPDRFTAEVAPPRGRP